jgi:hypothetical protein
VQQPDERVRDRFVMNTMQGWNDVRFWHLADISAPSLNVRFWG